MLTYSLPNGIQYDNRALVPTQHIFRECNRKWRASADIAEESRFLARRDYVHDDKNHGGPQVFYWTPYDLLGLFLSKLGPAQTGQNASKRNFYLPLTAVYGRWCMLIGGNWDITNREVRGPGVGDPSYFYNCTWHPGDGEFFLGAVLAGYD